MSNTLDEIWRQTKKYSYTEMHLSVFLIHSLQKIQEGTHGIMNFKTVYLFNNSSNQNNWIDQWARLRGLLGNSVIYKIQVCKSDNNDNFI